MNSLQMQTNRISIHGLKFVLQTTDSSLRLIEQQLAQPMSAFQNLKSNISGELRERFDDAVHKTLTVEQRYHTYFDTGTHNFSGHRVIPLRLLRPTWPTRKKAETRKLTIKRIDSESGN